MKVIKRAVDISHEILERTVKEGDVVVDATIGNGNDTLNLSQLVGECGKVYGFDIQDIAIENTKQIIEQNNLSRRVILIKDSHQYIDKYISDDINAVIFNLGYRPCGDHRITTNHQSTIEALNKSLKMLQLNGVVVVTIYVEHDGGKEERDNVLEYVSKLDQRHFAVQKIEMINFTNHPQIVVIIEKLM